MIERIKNHFSVPISCPNYRPFMWKLDGGGRELVLSVIDDHNIKLMLEIGVLYGGSSMQWLQHKGDLTVIGIDPWEFDEKQVRYWWSNRYAYGIDNLNLNGMSEDEFLVQLLRPDAAYSATISNLWEFRDRFAPVRGRSPDMLYDLKSLEVFPEMVYFDSDKELKDLWICNDLWPTALITGDDWTWTPEGQPNYYPVKNAVMQFASERKMIVHHREATWCLVPN